jgi:hypothetical protein
VTTHACLELFYTWAYLFWSWISLLSYRSPSSLLTLSMVWYTSNLVAYDSFISVIQGAESASFVWSQLKSIHLWWKFHLWLHSAFLRKWKKITLLCSLKDATAISRWNLQRVFMALLADIPLYSLVILHCCVMHDQIALTCTRGQYNILCSLSLAYT